MYMDGKTTLWTVADMAKELGVSSEAVNKRLQRIERGPCKYIGSAGLYTKDDLEAIRGGGKRGRPKVMIENKRDPKIKPKKAAKKN